MLVLLPLFLTATLGQSSSSVPDWANYCQEISQSSSCLELCETRMTYNPCGSSEWCRCGYCEKVWSTYYALCKTRWWTYGYCDDDECCDGSETYSLSDVCVDADDFVLSTSDADVSAALSHDSAWVEGTKMQTSAPEPAKESSKVLPTILALGGVALLAVLAAAGLWWRRRKDAALNFKNLEETNSQDYQSTDKVEVVEPAPEVTEMRL